MILGIYIFITVLFIIPTLYLFIKWDNGDDPHIILCFFVLWVLVGVVVVKDTNKFDIKGGINNE